MCSASFYHGGMENDDVVNGLLRRREVEDALEVAQGWVRQLMLDLDALDATPRLFRPDVEPENPFQASVHHGGVPLRRCYGP